MLLMAEEDDDVDVDVDVFNRDRSVNTVERNKRGK